MSPWEPEMRRLSLCPQGTHGPGEGALQRSKLGRGALKFEQKFARQTNGSKGIPGRVAA